MTTWFTLLHIFLFFNIWDLQNKNKSILAIAEDKESTKAFYIQVQNLKHGKGFPGFHRFKEKPANGQEMAC